MIIVGGENAGHPPLTIPFLDTDSIIEAVLPGYLKLSEIVDLKIDKKKIFYFPNKIAQEKYINANEKLAQYKLRENEDFLSDANMLLDEAINIDHNYSQAFALKLFILSEKIIVAARMNNKVAAKRRIENLKKITNTALRNLDDEIETCIAYKNIAKAHFESAVFILKCNEKREYLEGTCLDNFEQFNKFRMRIASNTRNDQRWDIDEGEYYNARTYHELYNITNLESYKEKACEMWRKCTFKPFFDKNKHTPNPFKERRNSYQNELDC